MKFSAVVVILALAAVSANAGLISPYGYAAAPYALSYAHAPAISLQQGLPLHAIHGSHASLAVHAAAVPVAYAAPHAVAVAPHAVAVAPHAVAVAAPAASYVAQNRGATHVAPLPGHVQSVSSANLEPAPGTL